MLVQTVNVEPKVEYWAIPAELFGDIQEYMAAGKHGKITLDFRAGQIVSWSLTKVGRIDKGEGCQVP